MVALEKMLALCKKYHWTFDRDILEPVFVFGLLHLHGLASGTDYYVKDIGQKTFKRSIADAEHKEYEFIAATYKQPKD